MRVDTEDYEGGSPGVDVPDHVASTEVPPIPESQVPAPTQPQASALGDMTNSLRIKLPLSHIAAAVGRVIQGKGFRLSIAPTRLPTIEEQRRRFVQIWELSRT